MNKSVTRRRFVGLGAAALALGACGPNRQSHTGPEHPAPGQPGGDGNDLPVFQLATVTCAAGKGCACKACVAHSANKLFSSREAAEGKRAHKHCKCTVKEAGTLPRDQWVALFGDPASPAPAVDRRSKKDIPALG